MAKQSGLGDALFVDGYNISGDVGSVQRIGGGPATGEVTGIDKLAFERLGLVRDGGIGFTSFFNDQTAPILGSLQVLKTLPQADRQVTYCRGLGIGRPAATVLSKQINYDGNRGQDGSYTFVVDTQSSAGTGLEWGFQATPGVRTDTTATSPASGADMTTVATAFGWRAYLHVLAFTGTSVTATVQDSADNATFAALAGGSAFAAANAIGTQVITSSSPTATVRRYVRVITTGTFTNAVFLVNFVRNEAAVV